MASIILGMMVSSEILCAEKFRTIAKTAAQKPGFLYKTNKQFTVQQVLTLYKAQIRPKGVLLSYLEFRAKTLSPITELNSKRGMKLIINAALIDTSQILEHRRIIGEISSQFRETRLV